MQKLFRDKKSLWRTVWSLLIDLTLVSGALWLGVLIRFEDGMQTWQRAAILGFWPWLVLLFAVTYVAGGIYRMLWRYAGVHEIVRLAVVSVIAGLACIALNTLADMGVSRNVLVLTSVLSFALVGALRLILRALTSRKNGRPDIEQSRVLIVGAGEAGTYAIHMCRAGYGTPVAFLDDDPAKLHMQVQGIPVAGRIEDVAKVVEDKHVDKIVIAMPSVKGDAMRDIISRISATRKSVYVFSSPQSAGERVREGHIRELNVSDFLPREEIRLDTEGIASYVTGKTVLVTGGGGSIGSEICRQLVNFHPAKLLIFDIYENTAYELLYDLRLRHPDDLCPVEILIGSIRDKARLDEVFETYRPQVVFHAAAHKHVPLMEVSPAEAVKNNVFGTLNLLRSASEHHVERLVQLSTDKAVNPTNVMGATKRVTEMLIQYFARTTDMKCMAVRFGNVLGSHGSVIPLWEQQIRSGGPVTVMDPDIRRFFMTIPEAAQLVLQAGALAQSGSIYVLDMGTSCCMMDLAEKLIRFYGYTPGVDMQIRITGLRTGEKMYEELMMDDESSRKTRTAHDKIMVAPAIDMDDALFRANLDVLKKACEHNDEAVVEALTRTVPTYKPNRTEKKSI